MSAYLERMDATQRRALDKLRVAIPEPNIRLEQDSEWCLVEEKDGWRQIRFHDYGEIYDIPGLYEKIFYGILKCESPEMIRRLVAEELEENDDYKAEDLRVLDLGAGNGMVAEELAELGVKTQVGVDIVPEAKPAVERDRPDLYEDYFIADMTDLDVGVREALKSYEFNCMTCVAALGFGDIPPTAFAEAYQLIEPGGLIVFNIKDRFLQQTDESGFSYLIKNMIDKEIMGVSQKTKYQHRLATNGDPLHYIAIIGRKEAEIPEEMIANAEAVMAS